jgi:hypothetical protein
MSQTNEYYLGNQRLKRAGVPINFTVEQVQEWARCARDPIYFVRNYVMIVNVDAGKQKFDLYPFQERMIDTMINTRFSIFKLPRQSGKTTTVVGMLLWYVLFHEDYSIAILAHKLAQSRVILGRLQLAYEALPKWLQQGVVEWNKGNIELENGCKILASATSSSAVRGDTFNLLYLDEFAHVPAHLQEEFYASTYPTVSSGSTTKIIITSTPKGLNKFYKLWVDAEKGKNAFVPFAVHWSEIPGRDEEWKQETINNTSEEQFRQEFETDFIGSSNTLINPGKLINIPEADPIHATEYLAIYEEPDPKKSYIITVDVARGVNRDASAFIVFDVSTIPYTVVARFKSHDLTPLIFPNFVHHLATRYNNAYVLVEVNDAGQQVADILYHDLEYEYMIFSTAVKNRGQKISEYGVKPALGVRTTTQVKRIGCTNFKTLVESDKLIINDAALKDECFSYVQDGDTFNAEEGMHDDLVMCCVIFSWLTMQDYFRNLTDTNIRSRIQQDMLKTLEDDIMPITFSSHGADAIVDGQTLTSSEFDRWFNS